MNAKEGDCECAHEKGVAETIPRSKQIKGLILLAASIQFPLTVKKQFAMSTKNSIKKFLFLVWKREGRLL